MSATNPPNFLVFVTDQLRADHLGCYGNSDVQTPHIDQLAQEGVCFEEAYVANPLCMPNRASLFTGQYPQVHGVRENGIPLPQSERILPEQLRLHGYQTASFGKIHLNPYGIDQATDFDADEIYESFAYWEEHADIPRPYYGFEELYLTCGHGPYIHGHYSHDVPAEVRALQEEAQALEPPTGAKESWKSAIPEEAHYNTRIADETIKFLNRNAEERPFFIWCSFPDPHHPYSPPKPYSDRYDPAQITFIPQRREGELDDLPAYFREVHAGRQRVGGLEGGAQISDTHYREILAHTYGMVTMVDHNVGRVMAALENQGLLDNTVVVFMSDHGDLMGDHWLINKGPFLYRGLTQTPLIWRLPGSSDAGERRSALVSSIDFYTTILDLAGITPPHGTQGRSYKRLLSDADSDELRNSIYIEYDSTYLTDRLRHIRTREWALTYHAERTEGLLFDLLTDPQEVHNLWNDPACQTQKIELLKQLLAEVVQAESWLPDRKAHA